MRRPKILSFLRFYSANMHATFILIYSIKMRYKTKIRFNRVSQKSIVRILRYSICFWPAFFVQAIDMDTAYLTGVRPCRERRSRRCYCQKNCCNTIHSSRGEIDGPAIDSRHPVMLIQTQHSARYVGYPASNPRDGNRIFITSK